jgi:hypothetical protein
MRNKYMTLAARTKSYGSEEHKRSHGNAIEVSIMYTPLLFFTFHVSIYFSVVAKSQVIETSLETFLRLEIFTAVTMKNAVF